MDKTLLLLCTSSGSSLEIFFKNINTILHETCLIPGDEAMNAFYARLAEYTACCSGASVSSVRTGGIKNIPPSVYSELAAGFIDSDRQTLLLSSKDNARFISFWRALCAGYGLRFRAVFIRDFSRLCADNPETALAEFTTAVQVLSQARRDTVHFDVSCGAPEGIAPEALWKLVAGEVPVYGHTPSACPCPDEFMRLPAEMKTLIRMFDELPMGGVLPAPEPEMLGSLLLAASDDSALHLYLASGIHDDLSRQRYTERLMGRLAALEKELSARIVTGTLQAKLFDVIIKDFTSRMYSSEVVLSWIIQQIRKITPHALSVAPVQENTRQPSINWGQETLAEELRTIFPNRPQRFLLLFYGPLLYFSAREKYRRYRSNRARFFARTRAPINVLARKILCLVGPAPTE